LSQLHAAPSLELFARPDTPLKQTKSMVENLVVKLF
jgi:hypothetical protein